MKKEKYLISGMSCAACSAKVEKVLKNKNGVNEVSVNLLTNSMNIEYDEVILNSQDIKETVEKAGYGINEITYMNKNNSSKDKKKLELEERKKVEKKNLKKMKKDLFISMLFLLILMYISMGDMLGFPQLDRLSGEKNTIIFALTQFLLVLPVIYIHRKYFINGFRALFRFSPNMDSLVAIGSGAALLHGIISLYIIAYDTINMNITKLMHHRMNLYFESVSMILCLISLGKYFEAVSKAKTSQAISKLIDLSPKVARVLRNNVELEIDSADIELGDILIVKPGELIAVDGVVIEGEADIDESSITGESMPVHKKIGDKVVSATINKNTNFKFKASAVGEDTTISRIINLVEEAASSKAPIAALADKISSVFVPVVMGISFFTFLVWILLGNSFSFALSNAIAVLVISCPCALGLATPVAIMVGTGEAAKNSVLIKSAASLQTLHSIDTVILDKTGTITEGKPKITDIVLVSDIEKNEFLKLAGSIEKASEHPLAKSVLDYIKENKIDLVEVTEFKAISGFGIEGKIYDKEIYAGNINNIKNLIEKNKIISYDLELLQNIIDKLSKEAKTVMIFAYDKKIIGVLAVSDKVKSDSKVAIEALKERNIDVLMLTGDNALAAAVIAKEAGVDNFIAEVLPEDKESEVKRYLEKGNKVAMVGDGINDSIALARATVGIAIGAGTDVAIESADVVLTSSSLIDVITAIDISKKTMSTIKQNLFWAFFYNVLCIPLAAGVFYKALNISLSPMYAAAAMSLSSVFVVLNALRLRRFKVNFNKNKIVKNIDEKSKVSIYNLDIELDSKENNNMYTKLNVSGMMCGHCKASVEKTLKAIDAVEKVKVSLENKEVEIWHKEINKQEFIKAITDAGYEVN